MTRLTGSCAPAILGLSPHDSPLSLYARLTAGAADPWARAKELGRKLEPALLAMVGGEPHDPARYTFATSSETLGANPDGWAERNGRRLLVIVKNCPWMRASETEWPPPWLWAIVQHELAATGAQGALAGALMAGSVFKVGTMSVNTEYRRALLQAEAAFVERLEQRVPPDPAGHDADLDALKALHPSEDGHAVQLGPRLAATWERCQALRARARAYRRAAEDSESKIRAAMGQHSWGRLPNGRRLSLRVSGAGGRRLVEAE